MISQAEHCFQFLATAATPGSPERRKVPGGMTEFRTPGAIMPPRVSLKIASSNSLITINADEIGDEADSTEAVPLPPPSTLMIQKTLEAVDSAESPVALEGRNCSSDMSIPPQQIRHTSSYAHVCIQT